MFADRYVALIAAQRLARNPGMAFDSHVLACAIAKAASEAPGGADDVPERLGLTRCEVEQVMAWVFPWMLKGEHRQWIAEDKEPDEEFLMLRDLLLSHLDRASDVGPLLAAIIARRALEPGHLWEAMGLPDRAELKRVIERHFPELAARNTNNMRWKRFFYRELCASQGFRSCPVPDCRDCWSISECFAPSEEAGTRPLQI